MTECRTVGAVLVPVGWRMCRLQTCWVRACGWHVIYSIFHIHLVRLRHFDFCIYFGCWQTFPNHNVPTQMHCIPLVFNRKNHIICMDSTFSPLPFTTIIYELAESFSLINNNNNSNVEVDARTSQITHRVWIFWMQLNSFTSFEMLTWMFVCAAFARFLPPYWRDIDIIASAAKCART